MGKQKTKAKINLGDLYTFNKQAMAKIDPLEDSLLDWDIDKMVSDVFKDNAYWMLLCRERNDYTVFKFETVGGISREMKPTLRNRGLVLSIDKQEDGNYEIWIRDPDTKENFAYYFFDYSFGVIKA